jgi:hypothetical protein
VTAGHAVPLVVLRSIQDIPDEIGEKAGFQWNGLQVGQRESRSDGGEEYISDKREIVAEEKDKHGLVEVLPSIPQIKRKDKSNRKKIVGEITEGHDIGKPRDDPPFHPHRGMDSKQEVIDPNQRRIDVGVEILDHIPEREVDQDDKEERGQGIQKGPYPAQYFPVRGHLQREKDAEPQRVTKEQRPPEGNLVTEKEDDQHQPDQEKKRQCVNWMEPSHRAKVYPKKERKSRRPERREWNVTRGIITSPGVASSQAPSEFCLLTRRVISFHVFCIKTRPATFYILLSDERLDSLPTHGL